MLNEKAWIVIPAYNEAKNIGQVIKDLLEVSSNIVVINDGSDDTTSEVVSSLGVYLVEHIINRGMGAALQTGNEFALAQGAEAIVHFDADGQMQVKDIAKMIEPIFNDQFDLTLGSRFLDNKSKVPLTKKYLIHKPAIIFHWLFTGLKLSDAHCGFRALSKKAAQKIKIRQDRMAHATEILDQIRIHDLRFKEIPVEIVYNEYGQRFRSGFKILRDLFMAKIFRK
jgi:polyprenyl-phospho-N-acetylgalactosaminyl synthase